jgi:hypothetical protein
MVVMRHHLLEELCQASDQAVAPANDVQAALVLMLFQDLVQSAFQFIHGRLPYLIGKVSRTL